jgi:peptidoglycan/LPS O-acetylase OafA/YrhL
VSRAVRLVPALVAVLVLAATLAACAKRSEPSPPKGEVDTYPRAYPNE